MVRHRISEACGHNPRRLVERYLELQQRYAHRLLPPATVSAEAGADVDEGSLPEFR
jgi:hypothetical protein